MMVLDPDRAGSRFVRAGRFFHPADADRTVYSAGDRPGAGVYREIERGIIVGLQDAAPLPDLNSHQPSRFFRQAQAPRLLRWLVPHRRTLDLAVLYEAGDHVPAGTYQDVERHVPVRLMADGPLPNLQTDTPSRYHRLRPGKLRVRRLAR
jgi:hypothetical protein